MKVLIVGDAYSVHTYNFVNYTLREMNIINEIVVWNIVTEAEKKNSIVLFYRNNGIHLVQGETGSKDKFNDLRNGFETVKEFGAFDVCHLHYLGYAAVTVGLLVRTICEKLISNYWGSDWLRADALLKDYQKYLLEASDYVVTDSLQIYEQLKKCYPICFKEKLKYIRFKMPVIHEVQSGRIDESARESFLERYHIPSDRIIVTCGYCASMAHNHKGIIEAIKHIEEEERKKIFAIVPMTYGKNWEYAEEIKRDLIESAIEGIVIEDYMSFTEVALLRLVTDIFINIEITDAYSSTMIEYTYCNKIVIVGKWLDYSELETQGAYYEKVDGIEELAIVLERTVNNFDAVQNKFRKNREAAERFQTENDKNELWEAIYGVNCPVLSKNTLFENMEDRIEKWVSKNGYQNIGVYGMGMLGGIVCKKIIDHVGADHVCAFDKSISEVDWYPNRILRPNQMFQREMDVLIVTPAIYMEEIKNAYHNKISSKMITYVEWLAELEKMGW